MLLIALSELLSHRSEYSMRSPMQKSFSLHTDLGRRTLFIPTRPSPTASLQPRMSRQTLPVVASTPRVNATVLLC